MLKRCAFLTLQDRSGFCIYDQLLFEPLARCGWSAEEIPWNAKGVDWGMFDAVVIRSTWDYQNAPQEFLATLESIEARTALFNPVSVCRWNLSKRYLQDMQSRGVDIVPTRWLDGLDGPVLDAMFDDMKTACIVVKPLVGANADDTFVLERDKPNSWQKAMSMFDDRELMAQPFVDAILAEGEYSLFFFGGQFSHAILKRPAQGDFRVQEEHGGIITPVCPPNDLAEVGKSAIEQIGETLLYARVDLVRLQDGRIALMELELIEPSLYFDQCPEAAENFVREFVRMTAVAE